IRDPKRFGHHAAGVCSMTIEEFATPQVADTLCLLIAAIVPIPFVLRWNWRGVMLGTVVVWASLVMAGFLLAALDPRREGAMLDSIWLLFGWIGGLLYCVPIYLAKHVALWLWRGLRPQASAADA